uniref:Enhancer of mRNA-decapping protein 4 n=1 Tax=Rhipicephalus zambeziensis TaxID=60191 RepID=A0A224YPA1_9ACAR
MAFYQALSVADPAIVVSTCEMVCPTIAIGKDPCPLEQPVLLSLIEQLCADLATRTAVKLKYLEEAVLSLDEENAVTLGRKNVVLMRLFKKIKELLKQGPPHDVERVARRLFLVTQSSLNC